MFGTGFGCAVHGDAAEVLAGVPDGSVDLVMTSPPYALTRAKAYGNAAEADYVRWLRPFAEQMHRVLKDSGSLVMDLGGAWQPGRPTRSLYQFRVLLMLCDDLGFHLAQEFYWWNPAKLPSPGEWVTIRRIRVKDAVNTVWWLSKTPWPKASNRRVLWDYSDSQRQHIARRGQAVGLRPSGHDVTEATSNDNGGAIPPNLIASANTSSNSQYLRHCRETGTTPHPARYPPEVPAFFVSMLTDADDLIFDPFAGSCTTGEAAETLSRRWVCIDTDRGYLEGAAGRFPPARQAPAGSGSDSYTVQRPGRGTASKTADSEPLDPDGGRRRRLRAVVGPDSGNIDGDGRCVV